ncbi:hypothetical protein L1987_82434 [Smallanthus sonchifolius]|uniref:Uncharacterized protein n=1 Tax=Smallanthus sonchifolius TaxID=185202 RepID=A0ACB8YAP7_9ASTR|nr:hypothetical protein L1987_82434 [Smallanthus sonchifolius]
MVLLGCPQASEKKALAWKLYLWQRFQLAGQMMDERQKLDVSSGICGSTGASYSDYPYIQNICSAIKFDCSPEADQSQLEMPSNLDTDDFIHYMLKQQKEGWECDYMVLEYMFEFAFVLLQAFFQPNIAEKNVKGLLPSAEMGTDELEKIIRLSPTAKITSAIFSSQVTSSEDKRSQKG